MKQDKVKQAARDEKLVPSNARVKIGKNNLRMDPFTKQREETYQVTLDIIKNTPFFNAFLILADTCEIDVDIFREILDISPKFENQEFTVPPSSESLVNFLLELGYKGKIMSNDRLRLSRIEILWGMYHNENVDYAALIGEDLQYQIDHRRSKVNSHVLLTEEIKDSNAYKMFFGYSTGLIPQKKGRGVPDELIGKSAISDEGVGTLPKVPDETEYDYEAQSDDDVWGSTDEETNKDKNEDDNKDDFSEEEENKEESVSEEENVDEENEEESDDDDDDKSFYITNTDDERTKSDSDDHGISKEGNCNDQKTEEEPKGADQAKEIKVGVLDIMTNKEKSVFLQSTSSHSISSNFDVPLVQNEPFHEVQVLVIPKTTQQQPSTPPAPPLPATEDPAAVVIKLEALDSFLKKFHALEKDVQEVLRSHAEEFKNEVSMKKEEYKDFVQETVANENTIKESLKQTLVMSAKSSSQPQSSYALAESLTEFELKKILMEKKKKSQSYHTADVHKTLYDGLVNSCLLDKDLFESYGQTVSLKRNREEDKDEDARPNQDKELKKRRTGKEAASSKKFSTTKESTKGKPQSKSSKTGKSASANQSVKEPEHEMVQVVKPPLTFDELMITPIDFSAFAMNRLLIDNITREVLVGSVFNLHKGTCKSCVKLEYNMEECYQALIDQLDWTNPEGHLRSVDMSKPLPLQDKDGRQVIPAEVFFNNDLEYLTTGNKERSHSSSITKALAARYTIESIEDMILILWSQVEKKQGYGYLKEFVVRRADQNLYKIKEDGDVIVDFVTALKPFNRGIILKNRIEDIQLGVESYQKETQSYPNSKKLPRHTLLHRLKNFRLRYNYNSDMPRKEWTKKDQKRTRYVLRKIDDQLLKRKIIRGLEVLVGGRSTETDKRLLQRTI
ncbi:hypothetical protein Tco_1165743 [Tanacetum coccineum]